MSVQRSYEDLEIALNHLADKHETSASLTIQQNAAKLIILGAASEFEVSLCDIVRRFTKKATKGNPHIESFVEKKGIARQYHTWFDWDKKNANSFYALFGDEFKRTMTEKVKEDVEFDECVKKFLEVGQTRNLLIHNNFTTYNLNKTPKEAYELYCEAKKFIINFEASIFTEVNKEEENV